MKARVSFAQRIKESFREREIHNYFLEYKEICDYLSLRYDLLTDEIDKFNKRTLRNFLNDVYERTNQDLSQVDHFKEVEQLGLDDLNWNLFDENKNEKDFQGDLLGHFKIKTLLESLKGEKDKFNAISIVKTKEIRDKKLHMRECLRIISETGLVGGEYLPGRINRGIEYLENLDIDSFRDYVYHKFKDNNYLIEALYRDGDYGIDFIINRRFGLKVKNYLNIKVESYTIQECYIDSFLRNTRPVVLSVGNFSRSAIEVAKEYQVELICLSDLINVENKNYERKYKNIKRGLYELMREK